MEKHWVEDDKDYFSAAFFGSGDAYIVFIPIDRTKEGGYLAYPHGSYQGTPDDRKRPMPYTPKTEPDARLIPSIDVFCFNIGFVIGRPKRRWGETEIISFSRTVGLNVKCLLAKIS